MRVRQIVQVQILGAPRTYGYEFHFDMEADPPIPPLGVGDKVEIPPNQVQEEGGAGTVVGHGAGGYNGPMKQIVRKINAPNGGGYEIVETGPPGDADGGLSVRKRGEDDLWGGFGEGKYA